MKRDDLDCQAFELGPSVGSEPDLGHLVILLLASTLAGLRDRLKQDGFVDASAFVADLTTRCDEYLAPPSVGR